MSAEPNPVRELEMLRDLVVSSIDVVKGAVLEHQDPPLTLHAVDEHPIHRRDEKDVLYALKSVASAGQMLRALCGPNTYLNDFTYGCHDQTSLLVACQADIPNLLGEGPCHIDELAAKAGLNAGVLARFLRNLCNSHIFEEVAPNTFANNALSVRYRSEALRAIVGHCIDGCRPASCKVWDAMTRPEYKDATEPTRAPFNIAYDTPLDYFKYTTTVRPEMAKRTQKAMGGKAFNLGEYLSLYPWAREKGAHIVDVGGAIGAATLPVLRAFPGLTLTVQDQPSSKPVFEKNLIDNFPEFVDAGTASFAPLDFFNEAPVKGAQIYFLRHIIHDWPDVEAVQVLKSCASAMTPQSKLLICEHMVSPTYRAAGESVPRGESQHDAPEPLLANWGDAPTSRLDLQVYSFVNAKQRTRIEYERLAAQAGLESVQVWRNLGDLTIVECRLRE
ncbi:hypothetical protein ASPVEDRAFT_148607 [Aspergillus versicolor CBS 583.65]|uniref:O-methyltransferase domain-containing protein n=1 Tax=Aspergillus versicolor CBS 583.65 TaxID=1036611 RepID=A0A1L9PDH5_ASPVE|nr:uncharacterized protein ASPVEDRAFT_148607 [Aspergillus versicolor CBS 583.65]OJI99541.1 hypothetical protein ASPVEDRAFT_148607 [Aspergillus versicolor CBS 583.65]